MMLSTNTVSIEDRNKRLNDQKSIIWLDGQFSEVEMNKKHDSPLLFVQFYDSLKQQREKKQEHLNFLLKKFHFDSLGEKQMSQSNFQASENTKTVYELEQNLTQLRQKVEAVSYELKLQTLYNHQRKHIIDRLNDGIVFVLKRKLQLRQTLEKTEQMMSQMEFDILQTEKSTKYMRSKIQINNKLVEKEWNSQSKLKEKQTKIQKVEEKDLSTQKNFIDSYTNQQIAKGILKQKLEQDIMELEQRLTKQTEISNERFMLQLYLLFELFINKENSEFNIDNFDVSKFKDYTKNIQPKTIMQKINKSYGQEWDCLYEDLKIELKKLFHYNISQETLTNDLKQQRESLELHLEYMNRERESINKNFNYISYMNLLQEMHVQLDTGYASQADLMELQQQNQNSYQQLCYADKLLIIFTSFASNTIKKYQIYISYLSEHIYTEDLDSLDSLAKSNAPRQQLAKPEMNEKGLEYIAHKVLKSLSEQASQETAQTPDQKSTLNNLSQYSFEIDFTTYSLPSFIKQFNFYFKRPLYKLTDMLNILDFETALDPKTIGEELNIWPRIAREVQSRFLNDSQKLSHEEQQTIDWIVDDVVTGYFLSYMAAMNDAILMLLYKKTRVQFNFILKILMEVKQLKKKMKTSVDECYLKNADIHKRSAEKILQIQFMNQKKEEQYCTLNTVNDMSPESIRFRQGLLKRIQISNEPIKKKNKKSKHAREESLIQEYIYFIQRRNSQRNSPSSQPNPDNKPYKKTQRLVYTNEERSLLLKQSIKFQNIKKQYSRSQDRSIVKFVTQVSTEDQNLPSVQQNSSILLKNKNVNEASFISHTPKQGNYNNKIDRKYKLPKIERSLSPNRSSDNIISKS